MGLFDFMVVCVTVDLIVYFCDGLFDELFVSLKVSCIMV